MLYIEQSLGADEAVIHIGAFHWMYNVKAVMAIFWGIAASLLMVMGGTYMYIQLGRFPSNIGWFQGLPYLHPGVKIVSFLFFISGVLNFAKMMVVRATTEIAITNQRLVFKQGLLARRVGEIAVDRIEGVSVLQSLLGRIFNYGRIAVRGMGVGEVVMPPIQDPIAFRQAIERARTSSREEEGTI